MNDPEPTDGGGLPDAGGLNIDYGDGGSFEPTAEQLRMVRSAVTEVAEGVRAHLTHEFTVTPRLDRTAAGARGLVVVEFPTGEALGPAIPITAAMFEGSSDPEWDGPIPPEEVEALRREITVLAVTRWAERLERELGEEALPAS